MEAHENGPDRFIPRSNPKTASARAKEGTSYIDKSQMWNARRDLDKLVDGTEKDQVKDRMQRTYDRKIETHERIKEIVAAPSKPSWERVMELKQDFENKPWDNKLYWKTLVALKQAKEKLIREGLETSADCQSLSRFLGTIFVRHTTAAKEKAARILFERQANGLASCFTPEEHQMVMGGYGHGAAPHRVPIYGQ